MSTKIMNLNELYRKHCTHPDFWFVLRSYEAQNFHISALSAVLANSVIILGQFRVIEILLFEVY